MGELTGRETPEQVADLVVGDQDNDTLYRIHTIVAGAIALDRAAREHMAISDSETVPVVTFAIEDAKVRRDARMAARYPKGVTHSDSVRSAIGTLGRSISVADEAAWDALGVMLALHADRERIADEWNGIKRPRGLPFQVVSTEDAEKSLATILSTAADYEIDYGRERNDILAVIAHRAHLNRQVNDAQTTSTRTIAQRRLVEFKMRGVMAWVVGDDTYANPYDHERDADAHFAWVEGWTMADHAKITRNRTGKQ